VRDRDERRWPGDEREAGAHCGDVGLAPWWARGDQPALRDRGATAGPPALRGPIDGFYEWTGEKGHRRPFWFHRPGREIILLAGLLDVASGAPPTFAVLTAPAREPIASIHDRMPVVLGAEGARAWLAKGGRPEVEELELLAVEVSPRVNSVANDDASVLELTAHRGQLRLLA
jgi:hypothetical protein